MILRFSVVLFSFLMFAIAATAQEGNQSNSSGEQTNPPQETTTTTTTTERTDITITSGDGDEWYLSPWVWIIGAAVFILLLVALLSGRRDTVRSDRVTVEKTVERNNDRTT